MKGFQGLKRFFWIFLLVLSGAPVSSTHHLPLEDISLSTWSPLIPRDDAVTCINEPSLADASEADLAAANDYFKSWLDGLARDAIRSQEYIDNGHTFLSFFAHEHWGSSNFGCNLEHGCHQEPKCFEVKSFQLQHRSGRSDEQIERDTNIIFLVYLQIYAQNNFFMTLMDGMESARESFGLISDKLAEDFTRQPDLAAGFACQITGLGMGIMNTIIMTYIQHEMNALSALSTIVGAAENQMSLGSMAVPTAAMNLVILGYNEYLMNIKAISSIFKSVDQIGELKFQKGQVEAKKNMQKSPDQPYIDQTYESDICNEANHGNHNFANSASMKKFAENQFREYRDYLETTWGEFSQPNMTDLESVDKTAIWLRRVDRLLGRWVREKDVSASSNAIVDERMQTYMMSLAWRGSRCWLECQVGGDFHATCTGSNHRFCPESNEICQAQCWTTFESNNHIVPLYGYDKVGEWQKSLPEILNTSRSSYFKHGYAIEAPGFKVDTTGVNMLIDAYNTDTLPHVPVCRSRNAVVGPVEAWSTRFACTCGDWMSNETAIFLDSIQMGHLSLDYKKGWASETYLHICPEALRDLPPLTHYRAFCGLDIRVGAHAGQFGKDDYCDPILHHIRSQRWTEKEANVNFCKRDNWGDADAVLNRHAEYRNRCKAFLKDKEKHGYIWDTNNHYE